MSDPNEVMNTLPVPMGEAVLKKESQSRKGSDRVVRIQIVDPHPLTSDPSEYIATHRVMAGKMPGYHVYCSEEHGDEWEISRMIPMRSGAIAYIVLVPLGASRKLQDGEVFCFFPGQFPAKE